MEPAKTDRFSASCFAPPKNTFSGTNRQVGNLSVFAEKEPKVNMILEADRYCYFSVEGSCLYKLKLSSADQSIILQTTIESRLSQRQDNSSSNECV